MGPHLLAVGHPMEGVNPPLFLAIQPISLEWLFSRHRPWLRANPQLFAEKPADSRTPAPGTGCRMGIYPHINYKQAHSYLQPSTIGFGPRVAYTNSVEVEAVFLAARPLNRAAEAHKLPVTAAERGNRC